MVARAAAVDAGSASLAALSARWLLLELTGSVPGIGGGDWVTLVLSASGSLVAFSALSGAYSRDVLTGRTAGTFSALAALFASFGLIFFLQIVLGAFAEIPREFIAAWFGLGSAFLAFARLARKRTLSALRTHGHFARRAVIYKVGSFGEAATEALGQFPEDVESVAVFTQDANPNWSEAGPSELANLIAYVRQSPCDEVLVVAPLQDQAQMRRILDALSVLPCDVKICPHELTLPSSLSQVGRYGRLLTCQVQRTPFDAVQSVAKTLFDHVMAGVALVLLLPLFAAIALAIKIDSRGPVIFRQRRNGYNQKEFKVLKFRTMSVMEDGDVLRQATARDARVTRVGRFLRRTSLDELPQLGNVVAGQMSLVGPRPHAVAHNAQYAELIGRYNGRHRVKPGITGWAQVNGFRGETRDAEEMRCRVQHDLYYIEHASFLFDLMILLRTVWTVFRGTNAH